MHLHESFTAEAMIYDVCESRAEEPSTEPACPVFWAGLRAWLIRPI